MLNGYIYLLQEREFLKTNEPIYKIGMTEQTNPFDRFNSYPNGSRLYLMRNVVPHVEKHNMTTREIELNLIHTFSDFFKPRKDIGREYFEGDYQMMIKYIIQTFKGFNLDISEYNEVREILKEQPVEPIKLLHINQDERNECPYCFQTFTRPDTFNRHTKNRPQHCITIENKVKESLRHNVETIIQQKEQEWNKKETMWQKKYDRLYAKAHQHYEKVYRQKLDDLERKIKEIDTSTQADN